MNQRWAGLWLALMLFLGPVAPGFAAPSSPVSAPFELGQHVVISALLQGRPVKALIDTGATSTVIDVDYAQAQGFKIAGRKQVNDQWVQTARIEYEIGGARISRTAPLISFRQVFGGPAPVQMIIGRDLFDQWVVEIDFDARQLTLHHRKGFAAPSGAVLAGLKRFALSPAMPVSIDGTPPQTALLDLGNESAVLLTDAYAASLGLDASRGARLSDYGGVNTSGKQRNVTLYSLEIAGFKLAETPAAVLPPGDKVFDDPVNIGLGVLKRFHLWIDIHGRRIWLKPGAAFADPFPRLLGLGVRSTDHGLEVMTIVAGGSAERAGLKAGDLIVAVEGQTRDLAAILNATRDAGRAIAVELGDGRRLTIGPGEVS